MKPQSQAFALFKRVVKGWVFSNNDRRRHMLSEIDRVELLSKLDPTERSLAQETYDSIKAAVNAEQTEDTLQPKHSPFALSPFTHSVVTRGVIETDQMTCIQEKQERAAAVFDLLETVKDYDAKQLRELTESLKKN